MASRHVWAPCSLPWYPVLMSHVLKPCILVPRLDGVAGPVIPRGLSPHSRTPLSRPSRALGRHRGSVSSLEDMGGKGVNYGFTHDYQHT